MTIKLTYVLTHPIQYFTPLLQKLAQSEMIDLHVIYATDAGAQSYHDKDFGRTLAWGQDLMEGYRTTVLAPGAPVNNGFRAVPARGLLRCLLQDHADLMIVHGWGNLLYLEATLIGLARGVPVIYRTEAVPFYDPGVYRPQTRLKAARRRLKPLLLKPLFRRIAGFLATGTLNQQYYLTMGVPPGKIFRAPFSIDTSMFTQTVIAPEDQRREADKLGLSRDRLRLIFVGKLVKRKKPADLIEAVALMPSRDRVEILFVGTGRLQPELEKLAQDRKVKAVFAGFRPQLDLPLLYSLCDVAALPSELDTWGLVVNEAMTMGLPAIVSNRVGCGPDLVIENQTGAIHPVGDVAAMARALEKMATDPDYLARLKQGARTKIAHYSIDRTLAGYLEAIRAVTGRTPEPGSLTGPGP